MRIHLPVETWIEILNWLHRRDLIKKLDSLWDREFTPIMQDWLHKYSKNVELGWLLADDAGLSAFSFERWKREKVPMAEVELPGNIVSFKWFMISNLNSNVLAFLRRLRPLFQINTCLKIDCKDDELLPTQTALHFLMPMIGSNSDSSIASFDVDYRFLQFFIVNHSSIMFNAKLLNIRANLINQLDASSEWLVNWLFTPRTDGQPRALVLSKRSAVFWEKLRQRFLDPARRQFACPFFVEIHNCIPPIASSITENVRTGEQLTVKRDFYHVLICNCALNNADHQEWLARKKEEMRNRFWNFLNQHKVIWLNWLELGPLDGEA